MRLQRLLLCNQEHHFLQEFLQSVLPLIFFDLLQHIYKKAFYYRLFMQYHLRPFDLKKYQLQLLFYQFVYHQ